MPGKFVTPHEFALSTAVLLCPAARRSGLPRRCAPRNDNGGTSLHPPARSRVPHTLRAKRPCTRAHVLSSACHCEPVRTLVWQSVSPQKYLASWQYLGRIRTHLRIRPKCCYFVMPCRRGCGLSRRFAPRNDMQKENRFCGCKNVVPNDMLKLAACPCNTGALPVYCRNSPLQPGQTALRFSTAPAPGHPSLCILQALPCFCARQTHERTHPSKRVNLLF